MKDELLLILKNHKLLFLILSCWTIIDSEPQIWPVDMSAVCTDGWPGGENPESERPNGYEVFSLSIWIEEKLKVNTGRTTERME